MTEIVMPGLDGANPLGFMAALGVLRAVGERSPGPRLSWREDGTWRPVLHGYPGDLEALLDLLDADRQEMLEEPALALAYAPEGEGKAALERDLKPPPPLFRRYLEELVAEAEPEKRRGVDWAASFASELVTDLGGKTKPTALHFAAGQQRFLAMVDLLRQETTRRDLSEALCGPWQYSRELPVLGWDNTASRDYALRASNPSTDKKTGVPGADWLAFRGLCFLGVVPRGTQQHTTGCSGGWKSGRFQWPLWTVPLAGDVLGSLLRQDVSAMSNQERAARGVGVLYRCSIRRSDQGGYGSFRPSQPVSANTGSARPAPADAS